MGVTIWFRKKLKKNHGLMMLLCCGIPLVLLIVATSVFGMNNKYLVWGIILLCPIMHILMMKDMHKKRNV